MYQQWLPAPPILPTDRLSVRITNLYMYVCVCVCMSLTRPPSMTKSQKWPSPDCREGRAVIRRSRLPCNAIQLCTKKLLYVLSHADTLHPRTSSHLQLSAHEAGWRQFLLIALPTLLSSVVFFKYFYLPALHVHVSALCSIQCHTPNHTLYNSLLRLQI